MKRILIFFPLMIFLIAACNIGGKAGRPENMKPKQFGMYETFSLEELIYNFSAINELPSTDSTIAPVKLQDALQWGFDAIIGYALPENMSIVDSILNSDTARAYLPNDIAFMWSAEPMETRFGSGEELFVLYAIKVPAEGPWISNRHIASAHSTYDQENGKMAVNITMSEEGSDIWTQMTQDNLNRCIAVVVDNMVYSCPKVMSVISAGNTEISGNFTVEEAEELAAAIAP